VSNFHVTPTSYYRVDIKPVFLDMLKLTDSKIKCAEINNSLMQKSYPLPCGYNPRELLKFFLKIENVSTFSKYLTMTVWFEDGSTADYNYNNDRNKPEIPKYLKEN